MLGAKSRHILSNEWFSRACDGYLRMVVSALCWRLNSSNILSALNFSNRKYNTLNSYVRPSRFRIQHRCTLECYAATTACTNHTQCHVISSQLNFTHSQQNSFGHMCVFVHSKIYSCSNEIIQRILISL